MEDNFISNSNIEAITNKLEEQYDLINDWKFISIVQFANVFKSVNAIDPISSLELQHSLKYPEIESVCLNLLLKLLMKKALFKPNSKIGENFEYSKLHEMLLKKINYFYKTYLRYLKKLNGVTDNSKILDLIKKDIDEYNDIKLEKYKLTASNLGDRQYEELDLKNLMVVEFFRSMNGRNPFLKQDENMEKYMNQEDKEEQVIESTYENSKNKNLPADTSYIENYLNFNELSLREKVEVLFFFCNYALTFSGRSSFFREELMKDVKDPLYSHISHKRVTALGHDSDSYAYYSILCNKDCRIFKEKEDKSLELVVRNYADLEQFIYSLETKSANLDNIINFPESNLLKNIRENLLSYKENDDEEQKREIAFNRKQQAFEKAKKLVNKPSGEVEKYQNSDYFLMNISDHVITRNQLNQITRVNLTHNNLNNNQNIKPQVVSEDEKKRIKIEKERLERQKRLEKRNRLIARGLNNEERFDEISSSNNNNNLNKKRGRGNRNIRNKIKQKPKRKGHKNFDSSEDEYESSVNYSNPSNEHNLKISKDVESDIYDENDGDYVNENYHNNEEDNSSDIIIDGNLIYRYSSNQIELEGMWYMNTDSSIKERVSFLFLKSNEFSECYINKKEIVTEISNSNSNNNNLTPIVNQRDFKIKICAANLIECILLNKIEVFDSILNFLSGEYAGYFMYYGKTIEDRVNLNLSLQESLVRISGEGTNNLGNFSILGYLNFFRSKECLMDKNNLESDVIKIADFKFTKIYRNFNPNENYRVIKSYQHRRKKNEDDFYY